MLSIRQRLTLWYTLIFLVLLLGFAGIIFFGGTYTLQGITDRELRRTTLLLAETLARERQPLVVDMAYRLLSLSGETIRVAGLPEQAVPITPAALDAARQGHMWRETVRVNLPSPYRGDRSDRPTFSMRVLTVPLGDPPAYILQVGKLSNETQLLRSLLTITLLVVILVGLPAAGLGGWWLAGRALTPVRAMTETARRIEAANLAERLPEPHPNDELRQLAVTLNQLLDRLQAAFQRERRFAADISHDLRTPLTLIKSTIGVMLNRSRGVEELRHALIQIDGYIDRVTGMLDATLFLARADANQLEQNRTLVDFSELLTDLYEITATHAQEQHGRELTCEIAPELWIYGDRDLLTRLVLNLLNNAMQYTPAGGKIRLTARPENGHVMFAVEDNGVGIPVEDLPYIFERFYRVDKARADGAAHHFGLGLSIAQVIARVHGGEITVTSTPGTGTCFTVQLPRAR